MPLIATKYEQRAGRLRLTAPQRRQRVRQVCALLASGTEPAAALRACGITWRHLWQWCEQDATGELAAMLDRARAFGAHALAAAAVRVADAPAASPADAMRARNRMAARQWLASKWNPASYGTKPPDAPPAQVVHHVVHLPARGAPPDPMALPVAGELVAIGPGTPVPAATGFGNRPIPSATGASVPPTVRIRGGDPLEVDPEPGRHGVHDDDDATAHGAT